MKITKIEMQKKNRKRYSIYLDGEFNFGIHEDILIRCGLYVDQEIDQDYINDVLKKEEQSKANSYAVNLISYRSRSENEIVKKMGEKDYPMEVIGETIEFLTRNNLIDDYQFALMFIRDKTSLSRHSMTRIKHDLRQKGVPKEIIQKAIFDIEDENYNPDYENAKYLSYKKYKDLKLRTKYKDLSEYEIKQKVYHSISQKGFNIYTIKDALEEVLNSDINVF